MSKPLTQQHAELKQVVSLEREALLWEWQSPTVPACNKHPIKDYTDAQPVPRYKGAPTSTKTLEERRKNWVKRFVE